MLLNYNVMRTSLAAAEKKTLAVAVAQDEGILRAVIRVKEEELAESILIGDERKILSLLSQIGAGKDFKIFDQHDDSVAALEASWLVSTGEADVLLKGQVNSSIFLKAVLDRKHGLRAGNMLSHLAVLEIPGQERLKFYTDAGLNPFPDYNQKVEIVKNALSALHTLGLDCPKTAVLSANEQVSENMPSTVDAARLAELARSCGLPECILEGPVTFDVAVSREAAENKGIQSRIAGETDLFLFPNIEAGNMTVKSIMYQAGAKMAGVILGASAPVVLTSRASDAEEKINSIVLACALSG